MTVIVGNQPVNFYVKGKVYTFASDDYEDNYEEIHHQMTAIAEGWA